MTRLNLLLLLRLGDRHVFAVGDHASWNGRPERVRFVRPRTLGHASRIPGVTPAAVSLVNVFIEIQAKRREQAAAI